MAPVIHRAQDGNAVQRSGYVCLRAVVFVRLGLDMCAHMVWR